MVFMKVNISKKIKLYSKMLRIRVIEEKISTTYHQQEMRCPIHLSIGQEAIAVGICENLKKSDKIVTAHRSHAHFLAKGGSLKGMIAELYGKETGCAKGLGGSMHLIDLKAGVCAAVPIVGSTIPIGTGIAWANKLKKNKDVVVCFFGDGATEEGVFFESLDFASLHNLPILFICENNEYSVYSHISSRQSNKRDISKIARSLGINSLRIYGNSVEDIFLKSKKIINNIRKSSNPFLIELKTFRNLEHCGPNNDDDLGYRSKKYLNFWKTKCPIENYSNFLKNKKYLSDIRKIKIKRLIEDEVDKAFNFAKKSKFPKKIFLKKYIYAK
jgi:TPP-dependent pyruvate/acetoin dehydrogenase alpha subunit